MIAPRTLVVMPNWVGDCVMAEPVLRALVDSGRELTLLAKRPLHPLLALFAGAPKTLAREADDRATVAALAAAGCDEAIVLPSSFRAAKLVRDAGIRRRLGYRGDFRGPLLAPAVARPRGRRPQIEDYRELLAAAGVAAPADWTPRLELPPQLRESGRLRLDRARLAPDARPLIGLFPGAEWGASKRWPWRRFAELANELRRRLPASRQLVVAGPKEVWLAVRVFEESGKIHPVIGPELDLAALAGVLSHLDLLVTNDSGPMHLAAALGVPCVALFGPTDRRRTAPAGEGHVVLARDLWCSPCFRRRCPLVHHGCLRGITVAQVAAAVEQRLATEE
ncbi:MAG: lipopolysaccharide heptosyltransferase II [Thermoanaerobaculia bacterium]|nr:lipopolysaccharide heptosyltransferase II [Thermoanaerobaculia bacterium]